MKRTGYLFEKITDIDNIRLAVRKALKGKRKYWIARRINKNPDKYAFRIQKMLLEQTYIPSSYHTKTIWEPKERLIYIQPIFPDRIIQHAIINVLGPFWDDIFSPRSFACRDNKGLRPGSVFTSQYVRKNKYCLKMDIRKFYPSLDHSIMKDIFRKKIKDKKVLALLDSIVDSIEGEKNVPIGNLTSQWFGNLYMNELDTFVETKLGCKQYIRYCDDFCLFSNSKEQLNEWRSRIKLFLESRLKSSLSRDDLFPTSRGVDFLGYRHFKRYLLLRKSTAARIRRRLRFFESTLVKSENQSILYLGRIRSSIASALGYLKWANSWNFQKKTRVRELFECVRQRSKNLENLTYRA